MKFTLGKQDVVGKLSRLPNTLYYDRLNQEIIRVGDFLNAMYEWMPGERNQVLFMAVNPTQGTWCSAGIDSFLESMSDKIGITKHWMRTSMYPGPKMGPWIYADNNMYGIHYVNFRSNESRPEDEDILYVGDYSPMRYDEYMERFRPIQNDVVINRMDKTVPMADTSNKLMKQISKTVIKSDDYITFDACELIITRIKALSDRG